MVYSDETSLYHKLGNFCSQNFSKNFRMINFHMVHMCMKIFKYKYLLTHVQVEVHMYVRKMVTSIPNHFVLST